MSDTEKESMAIRDRMASSLFLEFLPHYWDIADDLPAYIKLKLVLNRFTSICDACTILCNDISDRKLRMQLDGMLRHMQTWHEMSSITELEIEIAKTIIKDYVDILDTYCPNLPSSVQVIIDENVAYYNQFILDLDKSR